MAFPGSERRLDIRIVNHKGKNPESLTAVDARDALNWSRPAITGSGSLSCKKRGSIRILDKRSTPTRRRRKIDMTLQLILLLCSKDGDDGTAVNTTTDEQQIDEHR